MVDETQGVVDVIDDGWRIINDKRKPVIDIIIAHKKVDIATRDWVLTYYVSDNPQLKGEHGHDFWTRENIQAIDIRSSVSHEHLCDLRDEVRRTINLKRKNCPIDGYDRMDNESGPGDLSDKMRGLFRWVVHVRMTGYYKKISVT